LRGDDPAARPLIAAIAARECDGADDTVAIDDGSPHLQPETTVLFTLRGNERVSQRRMRRKIPARVVRALVVGTRRDRAHCHFPQDYETHHRSTVRHLSTPL